MISIASAAAAYANAAAQGKAPGLEPRADEGGTGFAQLVNDALGSTKEALQSGEKLSLDAVTGKADLNQVVTAVTNADMALQTVVAVRDKVISAYQDIIKMSI